MNDFLTTALDQNPLDPYKRVNYTRGLVLGEDEFDQEQLYFLERDRLQNRALHGYGTLCGLDITMRGAGETFEVVVSPGLAINPRGEVIRVPAAQCARLNAWLAREQDAVVQRLGSPPGLVSVYVVLCYRECATDLVPVPGEPCRTQDDSMAASRIADHFELSLRLDAPDQVEEVVVRRFGALLGRILITDEPGPFVSQADLEREVRALVEEGGSPPLEWPAPAGSPPLGGSTLRLHPDDACDFLRAAFGVWVTEVRPALLACGKNCAAGPPDERCVVLARLDFGLDPDGGVAGDVVAIEQGERPYLLHTRLLQEWLMCGRLQMMAGTGQPPAEHPHTHRLADLSDVDVAAAVDGQVLTRQAGRWTGAPVPAGVISHGALTGLGNDDHLQYLRTDGTRALTGDLSAGTHRITGLAAATANGHAVRFEQAIKVSDAAAGDLAGTYPAPTVARLLGRPLGAAAPAVNNVLTWNGAQWVPQPVVAAPTRTRRTLPFVTITRLHSNIFLLWFNLDARRNREEIPGLSPSSLQVFAETNVGPDFLVAIDISEITRLDRNLFRVQTKDERPLMRFTFLAAEVPLVSGGTVADYIKAEDVAFMGFDRDSETITAFVLGSQQG